MRYLVDDLPSGFRGYPSGLQIYYSPFLIGELKYFFKIDKNSVVDIIDLYVSKVEIEGVEGFSVWDLWYGDFQYLVVQIYMLTLEDANLDMRISCDCGEQFMYSFDLRKSEWKTLDMDVPVKFGDLVLRPVRVRDFKALVQENFDVEKLLDIYVESDKPLGERLIGDIKVGSFMKVVKELDIGILPLRGVCEKCKKEVEVSVNLSFFSLV